MSWHEQNINFNALIKQLFNGKDRNEKAEAARQLGFLKDGRVVNLLCKALKEEQDPLITTRIIEALGRIGHAKATIVIIEKLNEEMKKEYADKLTLIFIIESFKRLRDRRALMYVSDFLDSPDQDLKKLAEETFTAIEPNWRKIVEKERREKSFHDIFKVKI